MEHVNDAKSMKSTWSMNNITRSVNSRRAVTPQNHHTVTICTTKLVELMKSSAGLADWEDNNQLGVVYL